MAVPDYQTLMLPLLRLAGNGVEHKFRDAVEALALEFQLTAEERSELLPSGSAFIFDNRVGWARTYLKQAALLESPRRGVFRITDRGVTVLAKNPTRIDVKYLDQFAEFREFRSRRPDDAVPPKGSFEQPVQQVADADTPEDRLAAAYRRLRRELEAELLEQVKSSSPAFFERLVIDLLLACCANRETIS